MPIPLALMAVPAAIQGVTSVAQLIQAKKMQDELGERVNYEIPEEAKRALALMQGLASSREMPGQASMQAMMDLQAQKAYGNASRAAISSQDLLGVATALGEQGQENQLNLGIQAAQDYQRRQQALYGALENMAGYQEKVTADKQKDWYERAEAAAQMKEGGLQNLMGAAQGIGQMGMMKMMYGGAGVDAVRPSLSEGVEKISSIGASQLPIEGTPEGLMRNKTITGFDPSKLSGFSTPQLPVNQTGLMPTSSMMGRTFFPQMSTINGIQGQLPVNQSGLMPTTSIRDMLNMFNSYQSM